MGSYRLIKRGVLFSAEGDAITRADLTTEEIDTEVIAGSGKPVPVVFGTRFITPTVVGWWLPVGSATQYYRISNPDFVRNNYDRNDAEDTVRMVILTLRMVVCVGYAEINQWSAGDIDFTPVAPRSSSAGTARADYNYDRYTTAPSDANMFGAIFEGGLGFPLQSATIRLTTAPYSEFWLMRGGDYFGDTPKKFISDDRIDLGSEARGVTSLYFDGFNFGGKLPPEQWRVLTTRVHNKTQRINGVYPRQWDGGVNSLAYIPPGFMNPVVALREMLTDPDWGEGINESQIDDGSFILAARTCRDEGLPYSAVYDKLGAIDKLVKSTTDYIDGIVYYEAATDKVRIKLIREDYTFTNIPTFDETNISQIKNYQRQHGHELINSVTIKYHDALKGSNEAVTVHDLEASSRVRKVVSATLNYDGCATNAAAVKVAERELTALSKAVISFSATVNATEVLGLGDAVLVSWQDLEIARIVMRVSRIDYGDGTTGGITLHLIQDVFANLSTFDDIVGDEPLPDDTPTLIMLQENIKFLEMSDRDLLGAMGPDGQPLILSPLGKYIKAGVKYDPSIAVDTIVNLDGDKIKFSIGTLLEDIYPLDASPLNQGFAVYVRGRRRVATYIRINDEIMSARLTDRVIADNVYEYYITARAQLDTVAPPTVHKYGSDVWFLDDLWKYNQAWDGVTPFVSLVQQGIYLDRELLTPNINFVNRHTLPYPPSFVTVNGSYRAHARVDGAIIINWAHRLKYPTQTVDIKLMDGDRLIVEHQLPSTTTTFTIGVDVINLTGQHDLVLYVGAKYNRLNSWQSWVYNVDWSSTPRQRTGWSFNFGNDWGGDDAFGWGFDWNKLWGN